MKNIERIKGIRESRDTKSMMRNKKILRNQSSFLPVTGWVVKQKKLKSLYHVPTLEEQDWNSQCKENCNIWINFHKGIE